MDILGEVFGSKNTNIDMDEHLFFDFNEDPFRSQFLNRSSIDLPAKQREFGVYVWQMSLSVIVF